MADRIGQRQQQGHASSAAPRGRRQVLGRLPRARPCRRAEASSAPTSSRTSIPVKAGDIIGLDNANSALMFKTGVLGAFPESWTPPLTNGGSPSAPTPPVGTTANGYQLQIDAYLQPAPATTTTTTTTTTQTDDHDHGQPRHDVADALARRDQGDLAQQPPQGEGRLLVHGDGRLARDCRAPAGRVDQGEAEHPDVARRNVPRDADPGTSNRAGKLRPPPRGDDRQSECGRARKPGRARGSARRSRRQSGDQPGEGWAERGVGQVASEGALVRFHFLALPKSGKVKIVWRTRA